MKEKKVFELSKDELLRIIQDSYNSKNNANHAFEFLTGLPEKIEFVLTKYDKDEKGH